MEKSSFFKSKWEELAFLAITLLAFIVFYMETDIYTPSFPVMVPYFGTNEDSIQLLLSMNFFGLCLSSLFFGPASDAYGRKSVLCSGLSIFMLGSIGCAFAETLEWMVAFRFLQGLGCGSIVSAGLAGLFDVYPPERSSRLISILNGVVSGMMALAPILGNWIGLHFGWRANFYLIAVLATLTFFCNLIFTRETLPKEKRTPLSLPHILKNYGSILINFPFMAHTLIWCLMFSIPIVFIANLSLIFVDYLDVPKEIFGYYQMSIMGTFFIGSMGGAYLIKSLGMVKTKVFGSLLYIIGVIGLTILGISHSKNPALLVTAMALISLGSSLSITIYFTYSMVHLSEGLKGSAMSLTQSLRIFLSSSLVYIAANQFDGTTLPMSYLAVACTLVCVALYYVLYQKDQHIANAAAEELTVL